MLSVHWAALMLVGSVCTLLGMMAVVIFVMVGNEPDPWDLEDDDHDDQGWCRSDDTDR